MGNCSGPKKNKPVKSIEQKATRDQKQFLIQVQMQISGLEFKIKRNKSELEMIAKQIQKAIGQNQKSDQAVLEKDFERLFNQNVIHQSKVDKLKVIKLQVDQNVDNNIWLDIMRQYEKLNNPNQEEEMIQLDNVLVEDQQQQARINKIYGDQTNVLDKTQAKNNLNQFIQEMQDRERERDDNQLINDAAKQQIQTN